MALDRKKVSHPWYHRYLTAHKYIGLKSMQSPTSVICKSHVLTCRIPKPNPSNQTTSFCRLRNEKYNIESCETSNTALKLLSNLHTVDWAGIYSIHCCLQICAHGFVCKVYKSVGTDYKSKSTVYIPWAWSTESTYLQMALLSFFLSWPWGA